MNQENQYNIFARLYSKTENKEYALSVARKAKKYFHKFGYATIFSVEKYWKFDDSYEIVIYFSIDELSRDNINFIKSEFPKKTIDEVEGFIWNKKEENDFIDKSVYWCMVGTGVEVDLDDPNFWF